MDRDRFLLRQKHLSLTEKYTVFDESNQPIVFVKREAHHLRQLVAFISAIAAGIATAAAVIVPVTTFVNQKQETLQLALILCGVALAIAAMIGVGVWLMPKRHINFFADQAMTDQVLKVFQDKKMALINATYTVADQDLNLLGWCRKNYLYNVIRKRWYVHGPDGQLTCTVLEDSIVRSILRRIFRSYLPLMRTNFILVTPDHTRQIGVFNRQFSLFDKYVMDLSQDRDRVLDRRMALAIAVLLDTGERR